MKNPDKLAISSILQQKLLSFSLRRTTKSLYYYHNQQYTMPTFQKHSPQVFSDLHFQKSMFSFYKLFITFDLQELQLINLQELQQQMDRSDDSSLFSTASEEEDFFSISKDYITFEESKEAVIGREDALDVGNARQPIFVVVYEGRRYAMSERGQLEVYLSDFMEMARSSGLMSEQQERYWDTASNSIIYWMQYRLSCVLETANSDVELTQLIIMETFFIVANRSKSQGPFSVSKIFREEL